MYDNKSVTGAVTDLLTDDYTTEAMESVRLDLTLKSTRDIWIPVQNLSRCLLDGKHLNIQFFCVHNHNGDSSPAVAIKPSIPKQNNINSILSCKIFTLNIVAKLTGQLRKT